jgi:WD40 repeat protein
VELEAPDQWWTLLVTESYMWEHLAGHLAGAGDRDTLVATVSDPTYLAKRIARDGPHAGEADLAVTARLVPDDRTVAWWREWLARNAHLLAMPSGPCPEALVWTQVAATLLAWLEADPERPPSVQPDRLAPLLSRPYLQVDRGVSAPSTALVRVLRSGTGPVRVMSWAPDGVRLAVAGADGSLRLWNAAAGKTARSVSGRRPPISSAPLR